MHVLLATCGIGGDQVPFLGWGRYLVQQGHEVTVLGNGAYQSLFDRASLDFVPVISAEEDSRRSRIRQQSTLKSLTSGLANLLADIRPVYHALVQRIRPGETVVAANLLAMGARLVQEAFDVPLATLPLSPTAYRGPNDPLGWPMWLPRCLHGLASRGMDREADRHLRRGINRVRREVGLGALRHSVRAWMMSPELVINTEVCTWQSRCGLMGSGLGGPAG